MEIILSADEYCVFKHNFVLTHEWPTSGNISLGWLYRHVKGPRRKDYHRRERKLKTAINLKLFCPAFEPSCFAIGTGKMSLGITE